MMRCNRFSTVFSIAAVAVALFTGTANAELLTELGILDLTANGGNNPATGNPWEPGDTYRFIFSTSTGTTAASADINTYNTFVQTAANASSLVLDSATWKALASTPTVAANVNTSTNTGTGESIWLLNGTSLVADDYADLYGSDTHSSAINVSETGGSPFDGGDWTSVWTGSDGAGGIKANDGLGASSGNSHTGLWGHTSGAHWIDRFSIAQTNSKGIYGLSEPLTITIPTFIWDTTTNNWDTAHWLPEGGGGAVMPPADMAMVVNDGTVNVLSDLSTSYPAYSLKIARDDTSGTVNIGDAGNVGHLAVTSRVEVNTGGTLNVDNGTLDAGATLNVLGGTATIGTAGVVNATSEVNVDATGNLAVAGALNTPTLNTAGTTSISGPSAIGTLNADAGTVDVSTPTNAITTLNGNGATINSSGAALATNVNLASGTVNVAADAAADNLNVTGGQILAGANNLIVGTEMNLGGTTYSGTAFGAGGTITKDSLERLELNGGTVTITPPSAVGARIPATATASSNYTGRTPSDAVDNTGMHTDLDGDGNLDLHDNNPSNMWHTDNKLVGEWLKVDLGASKSVGDLKVWNYNEHSGNPTTFTKRGIKDATVYYSNSATDPGAPGATWTSLGTYTFTKAPDAGSANLAVTDVFDLGGIDARWIAFELETNHGGDNYTGFSELQFYEFADPVLDVDGLDIVANAASTLSLGTTDPVTFGSLTVADLDAILTVDVGPSQLGFEELLFDPNLDIMEGDYTLLEWDVGTALSDFVSLDFTLFETSGFAWELNDYLNENQLVLSLSAAAVPEPSTFVLAAFGLLGLAWCGWRRKKG